MDRAVVILGAGGHAKVVADILRLLNRPILGVTDPSQSPGDKVFHNAPILGDDECILRYPPDSIKLVNGVGFLPYCNLRHELFDTFKKAEYEFETVIHPGAILAEDVVIGEGVQIMAGAIIQPGAVLAENVIINTGAKIDHDCSLGAHSHVAPGATLCGGVTLKEQTFIGAGATLIQGVTIGAGCIIGAGSVVTRNLEAKKTVFPTKPQSKL